jgi:uncharacterized repeat protein (TIGR03899 family)
VDIKDVIGAGQIVEKLLATVEKATGAIYRPLGIRLEAAAEAQKTRLLADAQADAEVRKHTALARAEADRRLILDAAEAELAERASRRETAKRLQAQKNLDSVVTDALLLAGSEASEGEVGTPERSADPGREVDPDWMSRFIDLAEGVSGREMQALWSRVLAREVRDPGSFSVRSLEVLKSLTRTEAQNFGALVRLLASDDRRSPSSVITGYGEKLGDRFLSLSFLRLPRHGQVEMARFGLPYLSQLNLQQGGLLHAETLVRPVGQGVDLRVAGSVLRVVPRSRREVHMTLLELTPTGIELARLVDAPPYPEYAARLRDVLSESLDASIV